MGRDQVIVVKVELHSAVDGRIEELGQIVIANDGTGTDRRGNYWTRAYAPGTDLYAGGLRAGVINSSCVVQHSRVKPVWTLVGKAIKAMGYK
jgi:hypothetical protein